MPYISRRSRKMIAIFLSCALIAFASNLLTQIFSLSHLHTVLYSFLIIIWGMSVYDRVQDRRIREMLIGTAFLLLFLFVLRLSRWDLFRWSGSLDRLLWYALYIPYTGEIGRASCRERV